ncbi:MAG: hypothetical protein WDM88_08390 [Galbitalea sp.]
MTSPSRQANSTRPARFDHTIDRVVRPRHLADRRPRDEDVVARKGEDDPGVDHGDGRTRPEAEPAHGDAGERLAVERRRHVEAVELAAELPGIEGHGLGRRDGALAAAAGGPAQRGEGDDDGDPMST